MKNIDRVLIKNNGSIMTEEIQKALNEASVVVLDSGTYISGPLDIPSDTTLEIKEEAKLKFIDDFEVYPPVYTRWEGVKCYAMHPCLFINQAKNVKVTGGGVIDGSGEAWWKECRNKRGLNNNVTPNRPIEKLLASLNPGYEKQPGGGGGRQTQFLRPPLIQIKDSEHVVIENVNVINSPFWTIHPLFTKDLTLRGLKINNPYDAPNTDGIDIESSEHVLVEKCIVNVGDDGIALKSGSGPDGIKDNIPAKDVTIHSCTINSAHGGAVIGSETAGGIEDIRVINCSFIGTERGVRIKTRRGRGGTIKNLLFKGIKMENNLCPFVINMYYRCGSLSKEEFSLDPLPITEETPKIYNVTIEECKATNSLSSAGFIVGLPEEPIYGLEIKNCYFEVAKSENRPVEEAAMYFGLDAPPSRGFRLRNVEVKINNLVVDTDGEKIIKEENVLLE